MGFSFAVEADVDAQFPGGEAQLLAYLAKNAIDKIPEGTYQGYDLSAVKFTVDVSGSVTEVEIVEPFEDATIEELLHDAVCNMPDWIPAHFNDGTKVAQQFAFTVGNMENCKLPLLNLEGRKL